MAIPSSPRLMSTILGALFVRPLFCTAAPGRGGWHTKLRECSPSLQLGGSSLQQEGRSRPFLWSFSPPMVSSLPIFFRSGFEFIIHCTLCDPLGSPISLVYDLVVN